jgi:predicted nucleic acid-binding protein
VAGRAEAVIDASVVIKWFSEEEGTQSALKLRGEHIDGVRTLMAPDLLLYEVANALRYKPGFNEEKVGMAIGDLMDIQIDLIVPSRELVERSTALAYEYDVTVYDSCYLALSELMGVSLQTSDKRFYDNAKASGRLNYI